MFFINCIGIDLGTASVLIYVKGKGIILREPSVIAVTNDQEHQVVAVGEEAWKMIGRTPENIQVIRPLKEGVISDYQYTEKMLKYFVQKTMGRRLFKPLVAVCVPSGVTEVEKRAVRDAAEQIGARNIHIIEEPLAAAVGAGLDIYRPSGCMVVDIGGGTTDIAVISMGGVVVDASVKIAGDNFDEAISRYLRKRYNLLVGERTAEEIKIQVGSVSNTDEETSMTVRGRHLVTGLPVSMEITSTDVRTALAEPVANILDAVHHVLDRGSIPILSGTGGLLHRHLCNIINEWRKCVYAGDECGVLSGIPSDTCHCERKLGGSTAISADHDRTAGGFHGGCKPSVPTGLI